METLPYRDMSDQDRQLLAAARDASADAYAPYSGVQVGAAIRTRDGHVVTAANVENAAYGSTICAERMAVGRANATGARAFTDIAIAATGAILGVGQVVAPCGACRQVLHEMAAVTGTRTRVVMATAGTEQVTIASIDELLPLPFHVLSR